MRGLIRRTPECALHVHVGMPDPEAAIRAFNGLRAYLPLVQGLSANSPWWFGVDSGMARRPPLLLIAGSVDHISPISLNRKILKLQSKASSATELKEYAGRPHFMAGLDGWEEIADYALNWALEHARTTTSEAAVT